MELNILIMKTPIKLYSMALYPMCHWLFLIAIMVPLTLKIHHIKDIKLLIFPLPPIHLRNTLVLTDNLFVMVILYVNVLIYAL